METKVVFLVIAREGLRLKISHQILLSRYCIEAG